jgi:hypothetical protein
MSTLVPLIAAAPAMLKVLEATKALKEKNGLGDDAVEIDTAAYQELLPNHRQRHRQPGRCRTGEVLNRFCGRCLVALSGTSRWGRESIQPSLT